MGATAAIAGASGLGGAVLGSGGLMGDKPSIEEVDTFDPDQKETMRNLNELINPQIKDMLAKLGYDIEGNSLYQEGASAIGDQLSPFDPNEVGNVFDQTIGDPARESFREEYIPAIQERYVGRGGGRSSAAELLSTHGATKLETNLASRKDASLLSAKQQKEQVRQNAITQALQFASAPQQSNLSDTDRFLQYLNLSLRPHKDIGVNQGSPGLLPSLISAGGAAGAAYITSSREVKENIEGYEKGLSEIDKMEVKKYNYIQEVDANKKEHIGLIAEEMPEEIQNEIDGILHVDIYGLLAISINAIKELSKKVEILEAK